jgi:hypothetical protein
MKWIIPAAFCLLATQQAAAQVLSDGNEPIITAPATLHHMSAAAGESRTFVFDVPAGSSEFHLESKGGSGLFGVSVAGLGSEFLFQIEPSRDRGSLASLSWAESGPQRFSVTLTASPEEGFDDVAIRIALSYWDSLGFGAGRGWGSDIDASGD